MRTLFASWHSTSLRAGRATLPEDVADELRERCADLDETPAYLEDFLERHSGSKH